MLLSCTKGGDEQGNCPISASPYYYSNGGARIQFPSAFTPNADGRNDRFRPVGIAGITNFNMEIYDAAGAVMYRTNDPYGFGWSGQTTSGVQLAPGRYPVHFEFRTLNGETVDKEICVALLAYGQANCIEQTTGELFFFEDQLDPNGPGQYHQTLEIMCQ